MGVGAKQISSFKFAPFGSGILGTGSFRQVLVALQGLRMNRRGKPLESLVGEELSAVSFVRGYVEFHFDGPLIRALNNPIANIGGKAFPFPEAGSRDALCSFVGKTVARVKLKEHVGLSLAFDNGHITIPLDDASYRGPESFHWCPADGPMEVNQ